MEELLNLQKQIKTQDPWGTSVPYWVIKDFEKSPTSWEYSDESVWVAYGEEYTKEEVQKHLIEQDIEFDCNDYDFEEKAKELDFEKYYYRWVESPTKQFFLTSERAKRYLESNQYNFSSKAHVYCKSGYDSRELKLVRFVLSNMKKEWFEELIKERNGGS